MSSFVLGIALKKENYDKLCNYLLSKYYPTLYERLTSDSGVLDLDKELPIDVYWMLMNEYLDYSEDDVGSEMIALDHNDVCELLYKAFSQEFADGDDEFQIWISSQNVIRRTGTHAIIGVSLWFGYAEDNYFQCITLKEKPWDISPLNVFGFSPMETAIYPVDCPTDREKYYPNNNNNNNNSQISCQYYFYFLGK
jgi:hypothetical protein